MGHAIRPMPGSEARDRPEKSLPTDAAGLAWEKPNPRAAVGHGPRATGERRDRTAPPAVLARFRQARTPASLPG